MSSLDTSEAKACQPCNYPIVSVTSDKNYNAQCSPEIKLIISSSSKRSEQRELSNLTTCSCKPNCGRCKLKRASIERNHCKYQQPPIRTSCKPLHAYNPPTVKMDDKSVYRFSYIPKGMAKPEPLKPPPCHIRVGEGKVSGATTHNMSYQCYKNALPANPHIPCRHNLLGVGPFQDITTHKHDYVPKPIDKTLSCKPPPSIPPREEPFSDKTTSRLTYQPVNTKNLKVKPIRPFRGCQSLTGKMECNTTHRLSYLPYERPEPVEKPWVPSKEYKHPTMCMSDNTVYKQSYLPVRGDPQKSFKPDRCYKPPTFKMQGGSTYKLSYRPCEMVKTEMIRPEHCLNHGEGKISGDTTHKMSYQGYQGALPASMIVPCSHKLIKDDPMQSITTHRHDYVPKPVDKRESCRPIPGIAVKDIPVSDKTTCRLSYVPHDLDAVRVQPARIMGELPKPTGKVDDKTTHKLSYLPWDLRPKEELPWKPSKYYHPPEVCVDGNTIHSLSFQPPGSYIPCEKDDPDCILCPEAKICQPASMREDYPEPCCPSCCCQFPVAAC